MPQKVETLEEFKSIINGDKVVLVDFFADWCGPCVKIAPFFEELSNKYSNINFIKVNVDSNNEAAREAGVRAMPTFQLYKSGQKIEELVGANPNKLTELCEKHSS